MAILAASLILDAIWIFFGSVIALQGYVVFWAVRDVKAGRMFPVSDSLKRRDRAVLAVVLVGALVLAWLWR